VLDRETKKSKGFWFVTFVNLEDAKKALAETNEKELEWRKIFVSYAKENTERPAKTF
jgi:RNA recognition motif-containing protein